MTICSRAESVTRKSVEVMQYTSATGAQEQINRKEDATSFVLSPNSA